MITSNHSLAQTLPQQQLSIDELDELLGPTSDKTAPPPTDSQDHRDARGRFTKGCPPGPGRPRKTVHRRYVEPLHLLQRSQDMENASNMWSVIVNRSGPAAARDLLENLESEYGPICFRHLALQAITDAERKLRTFQRHTKPTAGQRMTKNQPASTPAATPSRRKPSHSRGRAAGSSPKGRPRRTK